MGLIIHNMWGDHFSRLDRGDCSADEDRLTSETGQRTAMEDDDVVIVIAAIRRSTTTRELGELRKLLQHAVVAAERKRMLRSRRYFTVKCLCAPHESPWMQLYTTGSDINFLAATSLTRDSFSRLLERFSEFYSIYRPTERGGRPSKLPHHHQVLGLILMFYTGTMGQSSLCQIFGIPPSTTSRILGLAEEALEKTLRNYSLARICWPSFNEQKEMARWVAAKEPLLQYTWGFIDGKNLRVQQPSNADLQNAMYNGWLHSVFVTGTICFAADGCIVWAKHNCPGSWNDSATSAEFRDKLLDPLLCPDPRYGVVSDSAFPTSKDLVGRIMTPLKEGDLERIHPSCRSTARAYHNAITSVRQAAEWGMGSIEKAFSRLLLPLPFNPSTRARRIENMFRMANYRVRTVGISQIRTVFVHGEEERGFCL